MDMKKTGLLLILAASLAARAGAQDFGNERDFRVTPMGSGVVITEYLGTDVHVKIPAHVQGRPVTGIADLAFARRGLLSVTIPDGVVSIGDWAFSDNRLAEVVLGESLTFIGYAAFFNNDIANLALPEKLAFIGDHAFNSNRLSVLSIPNSVVSLGLGSFANNRLIGVNIGNRVVSFGDNVFHNNFLTNITIGGGIDSLNEGIFAGALRYVSRIVIGMNVNLSDAAPSDVVWQGFSDAYRSNGYRAGVYTLHNGRWHFQAN